MERERAAYIAPDTAQPDGYKLVWIFAIASFFGVLLELFTLIVLEQRPYESRNGLVYGPFSPIYGLGAVVLTVALYRVKRNGMIFCSAAFLGGGVEYLCGWIQETVFGSVSWDYSGRFLSIGGRTSLLFMLCWGFVGLLWMRVLYPILSRWLNRILSGPGKLVTWCLAGFMVWNLMVSGLAVWRWNQRVHGAPAHGYADRVLDRLYPDGRLEQIFANVRWV